MRIPPDGAMKTLVNICAPERSGTTMLNLMLGAGEGVYSLGEIAAWFRLYRHRNHKRPPSSWKSLPHTDDLDLNSIFYGAPHAFHAQAFDMLEATHLIDSSKEKAWILQTQKWAAHQNFRVFNIALWKHPVDYAHSFWKRDRYTEWATVYRRYYSWLLHSGFEFTSLALDNLIRSPAETLQTLCEYLDLPYFSGKHRFWEHRHLNMDGSPGVREQVRQMKPSKIEKKPLNRDFLPLLDEVESTIQKESIGSLLEAIREEDLRSQSAPPQGHGYAPPFHTYVKNDVYILIKRYWLRLRHNTGLADWLSR